MSIMPNIPTLTIDDFYALTLSPYEEYRYILDGEVFVTRGLESPRRVGTVNELQSGLQPGCILVQGLYCTY